MPAAVEVAITNPYPGLRPFEPEEDYLFFGREQQTDELLRTLRQMRFVAVVGGSGSGKSSLVRAGLVPSLYGGGMAGAGSTWRVAVLRPGDKPIANLAQALYDESGLGKGHGSREVDFAVLETTLRGSSAGLKAVFRESHLADYENLLVVADQFEELFRYQSSGTDYAEAAAAFVKLLLAAAADPEVRVYVVLTMRSDFLGNCAEFPGLAKAVSNGQFLVPRMNRAELRRAITGPAGVAGGSVSPRLVVRLLNEAGDDPDQLPVLQHALMRSWDYRRQHSAASTPLDIADYEAVGTMSSALSKHAEEAYGELRSESERALAEKTFRALMETDEKGRLIRRPSTIEEIAAIADAPADAVRGVIERFRGPGRSFLVLRQDSLVDLSHESLMRIWDRLANWAQEEAEAAIFYRRLAQAAESNARGEEGYWINPRLAFAKLQGFGSTAAWAERYGGNFSRVQAFLEASRKEVVRWRMWRIGAVAGIVLLLIAAVAIYAGMKEQENRRLQAYNVTLEQTNKFLNSKLQSEQSEQASLQSEVASLRARQTQLTQTISGLTGQMKQSAAQIAVLKKDSDSLAAQVQTGLYQQNLTLKNINLAVTDNEKLLTSFPDKVKSLASNFDQLSGINAKNRDLFTTMVKLGVPMPTIPPTPLEEGVTAAGQSPPLKGSAPAYQVPPDAYLEQLLERNAGLLAEAERLANANRTLEEETKLLREENEKLLSLTADLREQAGRLDGEIHMLTSTNDMRKQQIADAQAMTSNMNALHARLGGDFDQLMNVNRGLDTLADQIFVQMQLINPINDALSNAIQDFQKKK